MTAWYTDFIMTDRPMTSHGERQKKALVVAAFQTIAELGFGGFKTREVARRVGVNIATLHYYFPSKVDLIHAVANHLLEVFQSPKSSTAATTDPFERLFREVEEVIVDKQTTEPVFIVQMELLLQALRDEEIRATIGKINRVWERFLSDLIQEGIDGGQFRTHRPASAVAQELRCYLLGMAYDVVMDNPDQRKSAARDWLKMLVGLKDDA